MVHNPITTKPAPAISFSGRTARWRSAATPMTTATAVDSTSAAAAATKTSSGGVSRPAAKSTVASWVLSPSSARNTVAKMARIWDIFLDLSGAGFGHYDAPSGPAPCARRNVARSEEHTSELQSLMRISYAVFCLKKKKETRLKRNQI